MWCYKPEDPVTMLRFYRTSHDKLWKVLFKPQKKWPATKEDIGLVPQRPLERYDKFLPLCSDVPFLTKVLTSPSFPA